MEHPTTTILLARKGTYDFAGQIRTKTIWKDGTLFCRAEYLMKNLSQIEAMPETTDASAIKALLQGAMTDRIDDREIFMKGIDYSYYYEQED